MRIVDLHCDTLSYLQQNAANLAQNDGQYDLQRARAVGIELQIFAMFTRPVEPNQALRPILKQLNKFYQEVEANANQLQHILKYDDIIDTQEHGKMGAILHLEGAECLGYDLDIFYLLYRAGLRSIGLTWNDRNQFADGVKEGETGGGLSVLGRALVNEMDRLGVILDLAHMSRRSFYDALGFYKKPVFVTHANAYHLCHHPRNLDDAQLRALAEHGGLIGITQVTDFVSMDRSDPDAMLDHMVYIAELIGVEYLALGSDFDGADNMIIKELGGYQSLPDLMQTRGFSNSEIDKILFQNALSSLQNII
jgi:membrane dipeptidase